MRKLLLRAAGPLALTFALGATMVQAAPQVGKPAPNFTGMTTAGKKEDQRGGDRQQRHVAVNTIARPDSEQRERREQA